MDALSPRFIRHDFGRAVSRLKDGSGPSVMAEHPFDFQFFFIACLVTLRQKEKRCPSQRCQRFPEEPSGSAWK